MPSITVWSDVACPFAHIAVARLHATRRRLGLDGVVSFDHRAFPLEVLNERPHPKDLHDGELDVLAPLEPDAGWGPWSAPEWAWPGTTLLALEAVQAAKEQSLEASEQLDLALRVALFRDSRCIAVRAVVLEVAGGCPAVDVPTLAKALDDGRCRRAVMDDAEEAGTSTVQGSPHLFLADGSDWANPGLSIEKGKGGLRVVADDPSVYEVILARAAG